MGKTEKIVVLGVLFLIVLILVVSLDPGTDTVLAGPQDGEVALGQPESLDPGVLGSVRALSGSPGSELQAGSSGSSGSELQAGLSGSSGSELPAEEVLGGAPAPGPTAATRAQDPIAAEEPPATRPGLLLGETQPIYEVPETPPDDWALRSLAGLSDHRFDPSLKVYTVSGGESFESLAERYYGDAVLGALLVRNNEGVQQLESGMQLLFPIHDDGIGDEQFYVVQQDDSLWKIAKKVYGKGYLWEQIFEANQDILASAEAVKPGMKLVIP